MFNGRCALGPWCAMIVVLVICTSSMTKERLKRRDCEKERRETLVGGQWLYSWGVDFLDGRRGEGGRCPGLLPEISGCAAVGAAKPLRQADRAALIGWLAAYASQDTPSTYNLTRQQRSLA